MKLCLFVSLFFVQLCVHSAAVAENKIKIGVSSALTGDAATAGVDIKNILIFANKVLANDKYELVFQDDRCNGKDAASVAHRLLSIDRVRYMLGYACSGAALAATPILNQAKIPTIIITASAAEIANSGEYIFRTFPSDQMAANKLIRYIASRHKVLGVLSEETPYCEGMLQSSQKSPDASKIEFVVEHFLPSGSPDFRTPLLKLKARGVDALFLNTQTEQGSVAALKQIKELGYDVPLYSAYWAASPAFLNLVGNQADGIKAVDLPVLQDTLNADGHKLFQQFRKEFGEMRSINAVFVTALEAFRALDLAISSGGNVTEFLAKSEFDGVFGKWHFDPDGEIVGLSFAMKEIRAGKPEVIE